MRLKTSKVLITRRVFRQIFEPYLHPEGPIFITSDAVSAGYNTLMTESFRRFERINARRLPEILSAIWKRLNTRKKGAEKSKKDSGISTGSAPDRPVDDTVQHVADIRKKARRYARLVIAVAMKLTGREPTGLDPALRPAVEEILGHIEAGRPLPGSKRLAEIFDAHALDPDRFRPRGFYRQSEDMQRYFRALRWLQTAPFRIEYDAELLAILILGKAAVAPNIDTPADRRAVENFFRRYRELTGRETDRDVLLAGQIMRDRPADMQMVREFLARIDTGKPRVDSRDPAPPPADTPPSLAGEPFTVMRIGPRSEGLPFEMISAGQAPAAQGIALCGVLGSNYARREWTRHLAPAARDSRLAFLDQVELPVPDGGLSDQYLNCLAALSDSVEPDAPLFMFTDAWEIKNCNTVLSGWVQAFRIPPPSVPPETGRGTEYYGALPEGFVEPEPEFFARMGELVERSREILRRCAVFVPPQEVLAEDLRGFAQLIEQGRYPPRDGKAADFIPAVQASIERARKVLTVLGGLDMPPPDAEIEPQTISRIRSLGGEIEAGYYADDPTYQSLIIETNVDLDQIWNILGLLCRRLEVMAHKQLRGIAFNEKESYFLADFGIRLATVMLQGGGAVRPVRDDFPILVPIPGTADAAYVRGAAVGRPRELLVLYPVQGREVLCHGAVVPYYETEVLQSVSDPEWIRRLDSDERPAEPRWLEPVVAPGPIEKAW